MPGKTKTGAKTGFDLDGILGMVQDELGKAGIEVDLAGEASTWEWPKGDSRVKVVAVAPGLKSSVEEMSKTPRDQVVMVRVDTETSAALDDWVQTGAVKSRSEAAALFIREGLNVRADELERLKDALNEVQSARERLRQQAREVFGEDLDVEEAAE
ncbi:MAG: hypothetical protein OES47_06930 [Acidobacteriota bacterium]|nr:hypothetical protein [Acidobacteriota bacterium]